MPARKTAALSTDETPTTPLLVIPPRLTMPATTRYTQKERDEAAVTFGLWLCLRGFQAEVYFAKPYRRWRFDYAHLDLMIAVEIEGGEWIGGRHQRARGFQADCIKYNHAALMGWTLLRFTIDQIISGYAMTTVETALACARQRGQKRA